MSDTGADASPVTARRCREHTQDIITALRCTVSVKQGVLFGSFVLLVATMIIGWNVRADTRMDELAKDHHRFETMETTVDFIREDQKKVQNKLDETHDDVVEIKAILKVIKKNGNGGH